MALGLTLQRLLTVAGVELRPHPVTEEANSVDPAALRRLLAHHREDILRICAEYGASNVRVFGSVARGDHTVDSDIDLLVDLPLRRLLLNVSGLSARLSDLLGVRVDVTTPRLLRSEITGAAERDAVPL